MISDNQHDSMKKKANHYFLLKCLAALAAGAVIAGAIAYATVSTSAATSTAGLVGAAAVVTGPFGAVGLLATILAAAALFTVCAIIASSLDNNPNTTINVTSRPRRSWPYSNNAFFYSSPMASLYAPYPLYDNCNSGFNGAPVHVHGSGIGGAGPIHHHGGPSGGNVHVHVGGRPGF